MNSIVERLQEWAVTIWEREFDREDKDNLYDELVRASDEIESLMEDLEAERKKHEWISVNDRLPENRQSRYWICTDTGYQCECRWTNNPFGLGESSEWVWSIFDIPQYTRVTHWMLLPDSPIEEDNKRG